MSFCGNCGTKLTEGQDFCPGCGAKVRGGTSTVSQTGQEPITAIGERAAGGHSGISDFCQ